MLDAHDAPVERPSFIRDDALEVGERERHATGDDGRRAEAHSGGALAIDHDLLWATNETIAPGAKRKPGFSEVDASGPESLRAAVDRRRRPDEVIIRRIDVLRGAGQQTLLAR